MRIIINVLIINALNDCLEELMHAEHDMHDPLRETIHRMSAVMRKHHAAFDALREETGLGRSAHYTLMRLADADDVLTQTEIAGILEISNAAVTNMLKRLEADGYVTRQQNPADTRVNNIALTDKGQRVVTFSREKFGALDAAMFAGFDADEIKAFDACLDRLQDNLDALSEQTRGRKEETL